MKYLAIVSAVREKWGCTFNQLVLQMVLEKNYYDKEQFDLACLEWRGCGSGMGAGWGRDGNGDGHTLSR